MDRVENSKVFLDFWFGKIKVTEKVELPKVNLKNLRFSTTHFFQNVGAVDAFLHTDMYRSTENWEKFLGKICAFAIAN